MTDLHDNFRYIRTEFGDLIDMRENPEKLQDLVDGISSNSTKQNELKTVVYQPKLNPKPTKRIPAEYLNKSWDELYNSEQLQKVYEDFPQLYDKLKNEKFPTLKD